MKIPILVLWLTLQWVETQFYPPTLPNNQKQLPADNSLSNYLPRPTTSSNPQDNRPTNSKQSDPDLVSSSIICEHGVPECLGNTIEACAFKRMSCYKQKVEFAECIVKFLKGSNKDFRSLKKTNIDKMFKAGEDCAEAFDMTWEDIDECVNGLEGFEELTKQGQETANAHPRIKKVPTTIMGEIWQSMTQILGLQIPCSSVNLPKKILQVTFLDEYVLNFSSNRKPAIGGVKDRSVEENQEQEFVEALEDANYKRCLSRINELKNKYMPETKDIRPPKVVKIEPLVPIDCFLNISLTRRGFKKCKFHGKPFAKITQPLYRRVSFDVFEGLWKIKDSKLERDSRPKIPRDVLERAAKFFKVPLDDFNCRLLTRLLKHYEEEKRIASAALLLRIGPCPIWRVSLLEIMQGLEKALHCKKEATIMDMACALTLGRFNVSNWHTPDVPRQRKGKRDWQDPIGTTRSSGNKSKKWHQVKEYVMFMADPCWHIYCIK